MNIILERRRRFIEDPTLKLFTNTRQVSGEESLLGVEGEEGDETMSDEEEGEEEEDEFGEESSAFVAAKSRKRTRSRKSLEMYDTSEKRKKKSRGHGDARYFESAETHQKRGSNSLAENNLEADGGNENGQSKLQHVPQPLLLSNNLQIPHFQFQHVQNVQQIPFQQPNAPFMHQQHFPHNMPQNEEQIPQQPFYLSPPFSPPNFLPPNSFPQNQFNFNPSQNRADVSKSGAPFSKSSLMWPPAAVDTLSLNEKFKESKLLETLGNFHAEEKEPWKKMFEIISSQATHNDSPLVYSTSGKLSEKTYFHSKIGSLENVVFPLSNHNLKMLQKLPEVTRLQSGDSIVYAWEISAKNFELSSFEQKILREKILFEVVDSLCMGWKEEIRVEKEKMLVIDGNATHLPHVLRRAEEGTFHSSIEMLQRPSKPFATLIAFLPVDKLKSKVNVNLTFENLNEKNYEVDINDTVSFVSFYHPSSATLTSAGLFVCVVYRIFSTGTFVPKPFFAGKSLLLIPSLIKRWKKLIFDMKEVAPNTPKKQVMIIPDSICNCLRDVLTILSTIGVKESTKIIFSEILIREKGEAKMKESNLNTNWLLDPFNFTIQLRDVHLEHSEKNLGFSSFPPVLRSELQKEMFGLIDNSVLEKSIWYPCHMLNVTPASEVVSQEGPGFSIVKIYKSKVLFFQPILPELSTHTLFDTPEVGMPLLFQGKGNIDLAYKFINSCVRNNWSFTSSSEIKRIGTLLLSHNDFNLMKHFFFDVCTRKRASPSPFQSAKSSMIHLSEDIAQIVFSCADKFGWKKMRTVLTKLFTFVPDLNNLQNVYGNLFSLSHFVCEDNTKNYEPIDVLYSLWDQFYLSGLKKCASGMELEVSIRSFFFNQKVVSASLISLSKLFVKDREIRKSSILSKSNPFPIDPQRGSNLLNQVIFSLYSSSTLHQFVSLVFSLRDFDEKSVITGTHSKKDLAKKLVLGSMGRIVEKLIEDNEDNLVEKKSLREKLQQCSCPNCLTVANILQIQI